MGSEGTHVGCCSRSASATSEECAVQQPEGGGEGRGGVGWGRSWEVEADDVEF